MFGCGLRASAAGRLRPARPLQGRYSKSNSGRSLRRTRTSGLADARKRAFAGRSCDPLGPNGPIPARGKPASERGAARVDLRDTSCSPPPGGGCGLLRLQRKLQIHNSEFKIRHIRLPLRVAACGAHAASDTNCGPPPPEAAARSVLTDRFKLGSSPPPGGCGGFLRSRKFKIKIQNLVLRIRTAACGVRASSATNCGPPRPGGCGGFR